jgi:ribokinase
MSPLILVVGSINTDFSARGAKLPLPGETIEADEFQVGLGARGRTKRWLPHDSGARVALLGRVGADDRVGQQQDKPPRESMSPGRQSMVCRPGRL